MPPATAGAASHSARVWLTTGDRTSLLAEQPPDTLGPVDAAAPTIAVDPRVPYQAIEGLGASITDSSATCLPIRRIATRLCARCSTPTAASGSATCASRWAHRTSSPARTTRTTTSPPARCFVRFIEEYRRAGVPIDAITLQNELQNRNPSGYPGMDLRDEEEARLAVAVGRALQRAGLHTKILGYDHNWSLHPSDVGPPDDPANPQYAASLLSDPAANRYVAGTAFHCHFGDPDRQSVLHDAFPTKAIHFTECSGTESANPATTFPDTLHWHTRFLTVGAIRDWAKTVIAWNLALDPSGGPHNGGCGTCTGVVTVDPATGRATPGADYYVLGHVTRFIRPGAARVDSTVAGNAWSVAFRNPDGSVVLVVVNDD